MLFDYRLKFISRRKQCDNSRVYAYDYILHMGRYVEPAGAMRHCSGICIRVYVCIIILESSFEFTAYHMHDSFVDKLFPIN